MTKPNYNYDIQKLYLEMFMSNGETFARCQNIFDPLNFDQRLRDTADFINKYVDDVNGGYYLQHSIDDILLDINNKFSDLTNTRIRANCEILYNILFFLDIEYENILHEIHKVFSYP